MEIWTVLIWMEPKSSKLWHFEYVANKTYLNSWGRRRENENNMKVCLSSVFKNIITDEGKHGFDSHQR